MSKSSVAELPSRSERDLAEAFPNAEPGLQPLGSRVLVQMRTPRRVSKGGVILTAADRDAEKWNTQVAKVVALGPLAFCNRDTGKPWAEGKWCQVGDFVRVAKYGGDRWEVPVGSDDEPALFILFNDLEIMGLVTGDPLGVRAYV